MLHLCLGPEVFRIDHQTLVDAGHLIVPRVVPVSTGATTDAETHAASVSDLAADPDRNRLIVDVVAREAAAGCSVLVLSGRVDHCQRLAKLLTAAGTEAVALTSRVAKGKRSAILDRFRDGTLKVVCATSLADEGLDVSRLERLVLATPARAEGRTIQRLGRLMRPHPGKRTPVLYDLVDNIPLARRQFAARKRAYRKVLGTEALQRSGTQQRTFSAPEGNDEPGRAMACGSTHLDQGAEVADGRRCLSPARGPGPRAHRPCRPRRRDGAAIACGVGTQGPLALGPGHQPVARGVAPHPDVARFLRRRLARWRLLRLGRAPRWRAVHGG